MTISHEYTQRILCVLAGGEAIIQKGKVEQGKGKIREYKDRERDAIIF